MTAFAMESEQPLQDDTYAQTAVDVYVGFSSCNVKQVINKKALEDIMRQYGTVVHVLIKKHQVEMNPPFQSGYAFVAYADLTGALLAAKALHDRALYDVTFTCQLAKRSLDRINKETFTAAYMKVNELVSMLPISTSVSSDTLDSVRSLGYRSGSADVSSATLSQTEPTPPPPPPRDISPTENQSAASISSQSMAMGVNYPSYSMQPLMAPQQVPTYFTQAPYAHGPMPPGPHYVQMNPYQFQQGYVNMNPAHLSHSPPMQPPPSPQYMYVNYPAPLAAASQQYYSPIVSPPPTSFVQQQYSTHQNFTPLGHPSAYSLNGDTSFATPHRRISAVQRRDASKLHSPRDAETK
eukprot:gene30141-36410_t